MIDIQLFVGCATCGWQQGCPREDLPPSALEGGACEAGGPGPRGGFLLPHVLSPQRQPCSPTPARHLMTCLNPPNPLFKGAIRAYGLSIAARLHCPPTPARHLIMPCQSFGQCFFACPVLKKFTDVEWCAQRVINYVSVF